MEGDDSMREEIYLQIVKQTSSKKELYTQILCAMCYCVRPSTRLYIPLLNFMYEEYTLYENLPKHMLNYCFFHLIKSS